MRPSPLNSYIKELGSSKQSIFISYVDRITELTSRFINIEGTFRDYLADKFEVERLSRKLIFWHSIDANSFLAEIKKAKIQLPLREEMELVKLFKEEKANIQAIQTQINQTDQEIDQMVYELYGLTDDEIAIVENAG